MLREVLVLESFGDYFKATTKTKGYYKGYHDEGYCKGYKKGVQSGILLGYQFFVCSRCMPAISSIRIRRMARSSRTANAAAALGLWGGRRGSWLFKSFQVS